MGQVNGIIYFSHPSIINEIYTLSSIMSDSSSAVITSLSEIEPLMLSHLPDFLIETYTSLSPEDKDRILFIELLTNYINNDTNINLALSLIKTKIGAEHESVLKDFHKYEFSFKPIEKYTFEDRWRESSNNNFKRGVELRISELYNIINIRYYHYYSFEESIKKLIDYIAPLIFDEHGLSSSRFIHHYVVKLLPSELNPFETDLYNLMKNDDVETLIQYSSKLKFREDLMDVAALYGAIKCFKYLLQSGMKIEEMTMRCAIHGNNYEIIHILEQKGCKFDNNCLVVALYCHHWDLVNYILRFVDINKLNLTEFNTHRRYHRPVRYDVEYEVVETMNPLFGKYYAEHINKEYSWGGVVDGEW